MLTVMVVFLFLLAVPIEWLTVLKHGGRRTKILHLALMLASFCVLLLYSLHVPLPSPNDFIMGIVEGMFGLGG